MDQIGVFSPAQARELWQWYLAQKQLPDTKTRHYPERRPIEDVSPHRVFVKNTSGEEIPAYGCMKITGVEVVGGRTTLKVDKPDSTDGEFVFNSQFAIAIAGVGWAYRYGMVLMLGDEPAEVGATYLPIVDSWEIEEGAGPFVVFGRHDANARALTGRFNGSGVAVQHGIITAQDGCGYYTVEKARWIGDRDGAGSGLGSGSGIGDCDPCYDVTGAGTDACGITLAYPPLQVVGTGVYVTAFDEASQIIPLVVGTACKMVNMGDTNGGNGSASVSGSGSDGAVPIWQILRGVMNHVVEYKERYSCCDGVGENNEETLLGKTPVILIGKECAEILCGECGAASGTGSA